MELRQLTTDYERDTFSHCLATARAGRGYAFREKPRSRFGEAHLRFGDVYGIFAEAGAAVEDMKAGFIVHDLATFPQSFPKPDLSELPPHSVIEGSDLWSLESGFAKCAAAGAAVVAGIMQVRAIVVYPLISPVDLTAPYAQFKFAQTAERMRAPYSEMLDGSEMWVQPMVLSGDRLDAYIRWGFVYLFQPDGERLSLRFERPAGARVPAAADARARSRELSGSNGAVAQ
jgi:hypothetical protein